MNFFTRQAVFRAPLASLSCQYWSERSRSPMDAVGAVGMSVILLPPPAITVLAITCTVSILSVFTCIQWHCGLNLVVTHLKGPETLSVKDHKIAIKVRAPHYCVALACSRAPPTILILNHPVGRSHHRAEHGGAIDWDAAPRCWHSPRAR